MAVDVRPSPFRDWVFGNSRPSTWVEAETHEDIKLDKLRARNSPNAASSPDSPGVPIPAPGDKILPLRPQTRDFYCQFPRRAAVSAVSPQSARVILAYAPIWFVSKRQWCGIGRFGFTAPPYRC